jgi:glycolate oxidase subunit GlcD
MPQINPATDRNVVVEPGALLATAPADLTSEALNAILAPHGLCLPIAPLQAGLSLATLVARNAGGRRRLRYGPIGRYLRAAHLTTPEGQPLTIGGPTVKRATGYGLNRALAGGDLGLGELQGVTFSLRPLPTMRLVSLVRCADPARACQLGVRLSGTGLDLSALALAEDVDGSGLLLAELEGQPELLARQQVELERLAHEAGGELLTDSSAPWAFWEELAARQFAAGAARTLDLSLPRVQLAPLVAQVRTVVGTAKYLQLWGDAGLGALHLVLTATEHDPGLLHHLATLARDAGAVVASELGTLSPLPLPRLNPPPRRAPVGRQGVLDAFRAVVGPRYLLTRPEEVGCYDLDASLARPMGSAFAVALPANSREVAALMGLAAEHGLPVVSRGAGSGLAGGSVPSPGALVIALNRLDQITIDPLQRVAHVGAGAITAEVQRTAEAHGLFYPPDPSSQTASTIGGNLACNAGGPRCVKYGVSADYLLALTAVLADGSSVRWGDGLNGQGIDTSLAQLMVGSEGTLGLITEATLRLLPRPPARRTSMALFRDLETACSSVEQIMAAGILPAGLELMDDACLAAVESYLSLGLPRDIGAMLLMLTDGTPETVEAETAVLAALAQAGGATRVEIARSSADEARLWQARRSVSIALTRIRPARLGEDIAVPISRIASCVAQIKAISREHQLPIVVFGHAGDGNLHPNILFDPADPSEVARLWPCAEAVFAAALAVGGTLSGEHGIGTLKRPFMEQALGATALAAQRRIKAWLDPHALLNPGKVLPMA